jgi:hypothetical protein
LNYSVLVHLQDQEMNTHNKAKAQEHVNAQATAKCLLPILKPNGKLTAMIVGICLGCIITQTVSALTRHDSNDSSQQENSASQNDSKTSAITSSALPLSTASPSMQTTSAIVDGPVSQWSMSATASGYPVYTSGAPRAIDWQGTNPLPFDPTRTIGRNGLQGNPPVDPPSSHGKAYATGYTVAPQ